MSKYAIRITEANLDLITLLNNSARPLLNEETFFLVETDGATPVNQDIDDEVNLFDENGEPKDKTLIVLV